MTQIVASTTMAACIEDGTIRSRTACRFQSTTISMASPHLPGGVEGAAEVEGLALGVEGLALEVELRDQISLILKQISSPSPSPDV
jgi:hypothetical protein